jgi:DEAD/DEAH box helicase domain-containing protein
MNEATQLMRFLMKRGVRVILFCKVSVNKSSCMVQLTRSAQIRKTCEQAMKTLRQELSAEGRIDILERVMSYRGGYSPEDRRKIEREAFSGNLLGLVATNALELGIDIGTLDAVIMLGFPFGIASFVSEICMPSPVCLLTYRNSDSRLVERDAEPVTHSRFWLAAIILSTCTT